MRIPPVAGPSSSPYVCEAFDGRRKERGDRQGGGGVNCDGMGVWTDGQH